MNDHELKISRGWNGDSFNVPSLTKTTFMNCCLAASLRVQSKFVKAPFVTDGGQENRSEHHYCKAYYIDIELARRPCRQRHGSTKATGSIASLANDVPFPAKSEG